MKAVDRWHVDRMNNLADNIIRHCEKHALAWEADRRELSKPKANGRNKFRPWR